MSLIVTHPFTLVVTVAKIFGLLSAKTPSKTNWRLFLYSLVLVVLYVAILVLRFLGNQEKTEQSLSKVVTYLHVLCYVAVFSANICSNWFNSKSFIRGLIRLEFFDYQIKPAVEIDYNNMKKRFYASFGVFWVIFFVVATVDFVGEIVLAKLDLITWISFYFPFFYNSFGLFIIYSTLFLKIREIVSLSPRIFSVNGKTKTSLKEQIECYFLMKENRAHLSVLGMFHLDPSVLLSMGASIVSYLIILIQFTDNMPNLSKPRHDGGTGSMRSSVNR
nr:PREDICTED: uncharacterized protein LOC103313296 isoform X3 [Tribolium castaneum]|eukprot:XP_015836226.1 PREDICTED: uncharacterized protein LOC103313296 isoform X3 [Tribolium castaneum]